MQAVEKLLSDVGAVLRSVSSSEWVLPPVFNSLALKRMDLL